jgi:hypothetical protein
MNALVQYVGMPSCGEREAKRRCDLARQRLKRLVDYAPVRSPLSRCPAPKEEVEQLIVAAINRVRTVR